MADIILERERGQVSSRTKDALWGHAIARTSKLSGWLEPVRDEMRPRDYLGAAIIFALAVALAWFTLAATP